MLASSWQGSKTKHKSKETQVGETAVNEIEECNRVRATMTLNLWLKTDDFPFNTPLSSPLSWVLPGAVTAPQLFLFHNKSPPTIQPQHTHTNLYTPTVLLNIPTIEASMMLLGSPQDTGQERE